MLEPGGELVSEVVIPSSGTGGEQVLLIPASADTSTPHSIVFHHHPTAPPTLPSTATSLPISHTAPSVPSTPSSQAPTTRPRRFYCQGQGPPPLEYNQPSNSECDIEECNRDFNNQYGLSNHYTKTHKTDRDPRYIRKINHQRHRKAAYLALHMLIPHPCGTQWTLPSQSDPNLQYQVNMIVVPEDCQCTITCNYIDCKVCLCRFMCSCSEWPADDIPCQHIHFVHMHTRDATLSPQVAARVRTYGPVPRTKEERALLKERFYPGSTSRHKRNRGGGGRSVPPAGSDPNTNSAASPRKARRTRQTGARREEESAPTASWATTNAGVVYEEEDDGRYYMEDELWAFDQKMQRLTAMVQSLSDPQNVARVSQRLETDLFPFLHSLEPIPRVLHVIEPTQAAIQATASSNLQTSSQGQQHILLQTTPPHSLPPPSNNHSSTLQPSSHQHHSQQHHPQHPQQHPTPQHPQQHPTPQHQQHHMIIMQ